MPGNAHPLGNRLGPLILVAGYLVISPGCTKEQATAPPRPPAVVTDLFIAISDTTSLLLTWTATGAHDSLGTAARYDLRVATADTTNWERMTAVPGIRPPKSPGQAESLRVSGLAPETRYLFQVQVVAPDSTRSALSNRADGRTGAPDRTPPGSPRLDYLSATENTISIGWIATGDDGALGTAARYELSVRLVSTSEWRQIEGVPSPRPAGQREQYTLTGLAAGSRHEVKLVIFDEAGNQTTAWSPYNDFPTGVADDAHWSDAFGPAPDGQGINGQVRALASYQGLLIAGGRFTRAGSVEATNIAAWNGNQWIPLGPVGVAVEQSVVSRLQVVGEDLFAAGSFTSIGGVAAHSIARWDGSEWHAMAEGSSRTVTDLTVRNGGLVAAGGFVVASQAAGIARWDGTAWRHVAPDPPGAWVEAVDGRLYCNGGQASTYDSTAWVSRLDGDRWVPILVAPVVYPLPYVFLEVRDLLSWQGSLCVCGHIPTPVGYYLVAWNGASWSNLAPPVSSGGVDMWLPEVETLASWGADLALAGCFYIGTAVRSYSIMRLQGSQWQPFGSGIGVALGFREAPDGSVYAMCEHEGHLFVAGSFKLAGLKPSQNIARWDP